VCQQSVGLIQRVLDEAGLSTISLTLVREITDQVKPSRALFVEYPFGHTFGDVRDQVLQRQILMDMLRSAVEVAQPGTIHTLPYRWAKDDLRERQLQKKAH
jgi:D-proline reductase (dithiol) PrdB